MLDIRIISKGDVVVVNSNSIWYLLIFHRTALHVALQLGSYDGSFLDMDITMFLIDSDTDKVTLNEKDSDGK